MPALTASEIARLRGSRTVWRSETCQVERPTRVRTEAGGYEDSYVSILVTTCRRTPRGNLTPTEEVAAARLKSTLVWDVALPAETDVKPTDRLTIDARRYEIISANDKTIEIERLIVAVELA
jgi:hypothetical protein